MNRFAPESVRRRARARRRVGLTTALAVLSLTASNAAFAAAPAPHRALSGGALAPAGAGPLAAAARAHFLSHSAVPFTAGSEDPDPALFGVDGKVGVHGSATSDDLISAVAVTRDGKILASGDRIENTTQNGAESGLVTRRNADGSPDKTFGGGTGVVSVKGMNGQATDVKPAIDGGVIGTGYTIGSSGLPDLAVFRLTPSGQPDSSFGAGDGVVSFPTAGPDLGTQLAIQPDGKIVVVGQNCGPDGDCDISVRRLLPNGALDPTFGQGGEKKIDFSGFDEAGAVALQSDGKIIVIGDSNVDPSTLDGLALRLNPDGSLDPTFGNAGTVQLPSQGFEQGFNVAMESAGKIDIVGYTAVTTPGVPGDAVVFRLLNNGRLDPSFNGDGEVLLSNKGDDQGFGIGLEPDGSIVISAFQSQQQNGVTNSFLNRITPSGRLDPAFGTNGTVVVQNPESTFELGLAVQPDGKIVVGGRRGGFGAVDSVGTIDRFKPNGSFDTTGSSSK